MRRLGKGEMIGREKRERIWSVKSEMAIELTKKGQTKIF